MIPDLRHLLEPQEESELNRLVAESKRITRRRFGPTIQLYAPLYLSNECVDTCLYCGFSRENEIVRTTLTPDQACAEADFLIAQGFRHLLLVSGEHPKRVSPDYLEEIIRRIRPNSSFLSIEVATFREEEYRRLREAGLDGVVLYQETYNRQRYAEVHRAGPKKDYDRRLNAVEEAARAGIRRLGIGVLLGLADWREEAIALDEHLRRLQKKYWQTEFTISLPRLRPCASGYRAPFPVSDRDFIHLVAFLRLRFPEVGLVLSTRERAALRDFLIGMGITQMSAGSRTNPGGYTIEEEVNSTEQFEIEDLRPAAEVASAIAGRGFEPVWKDWEQGLH